MRSVDHLLADGERIHLVTREHGVVLVGAFVRATVTLAIAGELAYKLAPTRSLGPVPLVVAICAGLVSSLALLRLVRRVAVWQGRRLVVTDRKVLLVSGALTRRVTALPLASIDGIEVRRVGALGPRCGALLLSANGRRCVLFGLRRVPHPERVMALMLHLAGEVRERRAHMTDAPAHHLQLR